MRISDEIDALEVMGVPPVTFLCATRLLAAWIAFPFMYLVGIGIMYLASYLAVVEQIGDVSSGGYLLIFWMFQNPPDLIFSLIKGMVMATAIVLVGCYYGYTAGRRARRGGDRDGEVDGPQHRLSPHHRDARDPGLLGSQPTCANRRLTCRATRRSVSTRARRRSTRQRRRPAPRWPKRRRSRPGYGRTSRKRHRRRPLRQRGRGDDGARLRHPRRQPARARPLQIPHRPSSATTAARTRSRSSTWSSSSAAPASSTASTSGCPRIRSRWCSAPRAPARAC